MRRFHLFFNRTSHLLTVCLLLAVCLAEPAAAQRRSYTLDEDPLRLGNKALAAGRLDEARDHFNEAVANDHHVPEALCGLAVVDLRQGLLNDAEARYRQALAASGGRHGAARAGLGLLLLRQGRDEEAATEFQQALRDDGKLWEAHYGLARLALAAGEWDVARERLENGRKKSGLDAGEDKYQYGLALYLLGTGDVAGAERSALRAQGLNPADPQYAQLVARIYRDQGHSALAISAYEQVLAAPGSTATAPLLHELGRLYAEENRFNEASERYLQAVAADSTYAPAVKELADLFRRARRYDKAAGTYLRYIALVPEDGQARLHLSECLGELGRFDEAAAAARAAWQQAPDDQAASFQFARAGIHARNDSLKTEAAALMTSLPADLPWQAGDLLDLAAWQTDAKDYGSATATLARAAALAPDDARIPFQRGLVELRAGRATTAVDHFQQAVTLDPGAAANHLNLGIARYQAGQLEAAIPPFRQAVALRPELATARLLLAQVLAATGSLPEAEDEYRTVLAQEPRNAKALRGLGFCRIRAADYPAATDAYTQAVDVDPSSADGWAGLGNARLGQGDLAAAEAAFARARAIDPRNIMLKAGIELLNQAKNAGRENQSR
ncbi:MAG: tetratricopeptide repeat protein [bacterium]